MGPRTRRSVRSGSGASAAQAPARHAGHVHRNTGTFAGPSGLGDKPGVLGISRLEDAGVGGTIFPSKHGAPGRGEEATLYPHRQLPIHRRTLQRSSWGVTRRKQRLNIALQHRQNIVQVMEMQILLRAFTRTLGRAAKRRIWRLDTFLRDFQLRFERRAVCNIGARLRHGGVRKEANTKSCRSTVGSVHPQHQLNHFIPNGPNMFFDKL